MEKTKRMMLAWILSLLQVFSPASLIADAISPQKPILDLKEVSMEETKERVIEGILSYDLLQPEKQNEYWRLKDIQFSGEIFEKRKIDISEGNGLVLENKEDLLKLIAENPARKGDLPFRLLIPSSVLLDWEQIRKINLSVNPVFQKEEKIDLKELFGKEESYFNQTMSVFEKREDSENTVVYLNHLFEDEREIFPDFKGEGFYFYKIPAALESEFSSYNYQKEKELYGKEASDRMKKEKRLTENLLLEKGYFPPKEFLEETLPEKIQGIKRTFEDVLTLSSKEDLFLLKEKISIENVLKPLREEIATAFRVSTFDRDHIQSPSKEEITNRINLPSLLEEDTESLFEGKTKSFPIGEPSSGSGNHKKTIRFSEMQILRASGMANAEQTSTEIVQGDPLFFEIGKEDASGESTYPNGTIDISKSVKIRFNFRLLEDQMPTSKTFSLEYDKETFGGATFLDFNRDYGDQPDKFTYRIGTEEDPITHNVRPNGIIEVTFKENAPKGDYFIEWDKLLIQLNDANKFHDEKGNYLKIKSFGKEPKSSKIYYTGEEKPDTSSLQMTYEMDYVKESYKTPTLNFWYSYYGDAEYQGRSYMEGHKDFTFSPRGKTASLMLEAIINKERKVVPEPLIEILLPEVQEEFIAPKKENIVIFYCDIEPKEGKIRPLRQLDNADFEIIESTPKKVVVKLKDVLTNYIVKAKVTFNPQTDLSKWFAQRKAFFKINPIATLYSRRPTEEAVQDRYQIPAGQKKPTLIIGMPVQIKDITPEKGKERYSNFRINELIVNDISLADPSLPHEGVEGKDMALQDGKDPIFYRSEDPVHPHELNAIKKGLEEELGLYQWDNATSSWEKIDDNFLYPYAPSRSYKKETIESSLTKGIGMFEVYQGGLFEKEGGGFSPLLNMKKPFKIVYVQPIIRTKAKYGATMNFIYRDIRDTKNLDWSVPLTQLLMATTSAGTKDPELDFAISPYASDRFPIHEFQTIGYDLEEYRIRVANHTPPDIEKTRREIYRGIQSEESMMKKYKEIPNFSHFRYESHDTIYDVLPNSWSPSDAPKNVFDLGYDPNSLFVDAQYDTSPEQTTMYYQERAFRSEEKNLLNAFRNTLSVWDITVRGVSNEATDLTVTDFLPPGSELRPFFQFKEDMGPVKSSTHSKPNLPEIHKNYMYRTMTGNGDPQNKGNYRLLPENKNDASYVNVDIPSVNVDLPNFLLYPVDVWEVGKNGRKIRQLKQSVDYEVIAHKSYSNYDRAEALQSGSSDLKMAADLFFNIWYEETFFSHYFKKKDKYEGQSDREMGKRVKVEIKFPETELQKKELDSNYLITIASEKVGYDGGRRARKGAYNTADGNQMMVKPSSYEFVEFQDSNAVKMTKRDKNKERTDYEESYDFDLWRESQTIAQQSFDPGGPWIPPAPESDEYSVDSSYFSISLHPIFYDKDKDTIRWKVEMNEIAQSYGLEKWLVNIFSENKFLTLLPSDDGNYVQNIRGIEYKGGWTGGRSNKDKNEVALTDTLYEQNGALKDRFQILSDGSSSPIKMHFGSDTKGLFNPDFESVTTAEHSGLTFEFLTKINMKEVLKSAKPEKNDRIKLKLKLIMDSKNIQTRFTKSEGSMDWWEDEKTELAPLHKETEAFFEILSEDLLRKRGISSTQVNDVNAYEVVDWQIDFNIRGKENLSGEEIVDTPAKGQVFVNNSLFVFEEKTRNASPEEGFTGSEWEMRAKYVPAGEVTYEDTPLSAEEVARRFNVSMTEEKLTIGIKEAAGSKSYRFAFQTTAPPPREIQYLNTAKINDIISKADSSKGIDSLIFKDQGVQEKNETKIKWNAVVNSGRQSMENIVLKDYLSANQEYLMDSFYLATIEPGAGGLSQEVEIPKTKYEIEEFLHDTEKKAVKITLEPSFQTNHPIVISYQTQMIDLLGNADLSNKLDLEFNTGKFGSSGWTKLKKEILWVIQRTGAPGDAPAGNRVYLKKIDENNHPIPNVKFRLFKVLEEQENRITRLKLAEEKQTGVDGTLFFDKELERDISSLKHTHVITEVLPNDYAFYPYTQEELQASGLEPAPFFFDKSGTANIIQEGSWGISVPQNSGGTWTKSIVLKNKYEAGSEGEEEIPPVPGEDPEDGNGVIKVSKRNPNGDPIKDIVFHLYEVGNPDWTYVETLSTNRDGEAFFRGLKKNMRYVVFEPQLQGRRISPPSGKKYIPGFTTEDWNYTVSFVNEIASAPPETFTVDVIKEEINAGDGSKTPMKDVFFRVYQGEEGSSDQKFIQKAATGPDGKLKLTLEKGDATKQWYYQIEEILPPSYKFSLSGDGSYNGIIQIRKADCETKTHFTYNILNEKNDGPDQGGEEKEPEPLPNPPEAAENKIQIIKKNSKGEVVKNHPIEFELYELAENTSDRKLVKRDATNNEGILLFTGLDASRRYFIRELPDIRNYVYYQPISGSKYVVFKFDERDVVKEITFQNKMNNENDGGENIHITILKENVDENGGNKTPLPNVTFRIFKGEENKKEQTFVKNIITNPIGKAETELPKLETEKEYYKIEEVLPTGQKFSRYGNGTYNGIVTITKETYQQSETLLYVMANETNTSPYPEGEEKEPDPLPNPPRNAENKIHITKQNSKGEVVKNKAISFELYALAETGSDRSLVKTGTLNPNGTLIFTGLDASRRYFIREIPDLDQFEYYAPASGSRYVVFKNNEEDTIKNLVFKNKMNDEDNGLGNFTLNLTKNVVDKNGVVQKTLKNVSFRIFKWDGEVKKQTFIQKVTTDENGEISVSLPKIDPANNEKYYQIEEILPAGYTFSPFNDGKHNGIIRFADDAYESGSVSYTVSNLVNNSPYPQGEEEEPDPLPNPPEDAENKIEIIKKNSKGQPVKNKEIFFEIFKLAENSSDREWVATKSLNNEGKVVIENLNASRRYFIREVADPSKFLFCNPASGTRYATFQLSEKNITKQIVFQNKMNDEEADDGIEKNAEFILYKRDQRGAVPITPITFMLYEVKDESGNKRDPANLILIEQKQTDADGFVHFKNLKNKKEYLVKETIEDPYSPKEPMDGYIFFKTGESLPVDEKNPANPLEIHPHAGKWVGGEIILNENSQPPIAPEEPINNDPDDPNQPRDGILEVLKKDEEGRLIPGIEFDLFRRYIEMDFIPRKEKEQTLSTNKYGLVTFKNLQRGKNYQIKENLPKGWNYSAPAYGRTEYTVPHKIAFSYKKFLFINKKMDDENFVPEQPDNDVTVAIRKSNEEGSRLKNVVFTLFLGAGNTSTGGKQYKTDEKGHLLITGLKRNSTYQLRETFPEGYVSHSHPQIIEFKTGNIDEEVFFYDIINKKSDSENGKRVTVQILKKGVSANGKNEIDLPGVTFKIYKGKNLISTKDAPNIQTFIGEITTDENGRAAKELFFPQVFEDGESYFIEEVLPSGYEFSGKGDGSYNGIITIPLHQQIEGNTLSFRLENKKNERPIPPFIPDYNKDGEEKEPEQPKTPGDIDQTEKRTNVIEVIKYGQDGKIASLIPVKIQLYELDRESSNRKLISIKETVNGKVTFKNLSNYRRYFVREIPSPETFEYLFPVSGSKYVVFDDEENKTKEVRFYNEFKKDGWTEKESEDGKRPPSSDDGNEKEEDDIKKPEKDASDKGNKEPVEIKIPLIGVDKKEKQEFPLIPPLGNNEMTNQQKEKSSSAEDLAEIGDDGTPHGTGTPDSGEDIKESIPYSNWAYPITGGVDKKGWFYLIGFVFVCLGVFIGISERRR